MGGQPANQQACCTVFACEASNLRRGQAPDLRRAQHKILPLIPTGTKRFTFGVLPIQETGSCERHRGKGRSMPCSTRSPLNRYTLLQRDIQIPSLRILPFPYMQPADPRFGAVTQLSTRANNSLRPVANNRDEAPRKRLHGTTELHLEPLHGHHLKRRIPAVLGWCNPLAPPRRLSTGLWPMPKHDRASIALGILRFRSRDGPAQTFQRELFGRSSRASKPNMAGNPAAQP